MSMTVPRTGDTAVRSRLRVPRLVVVALVALVTPLYFAVAGIQLSPSRLLFLVTIPVLVGRLAAGHYGGVRLPDWLMLAYVIWVALSVSMNNPDVLVSFVGSNALEILGGYLVARTAIRTADDFEGTVRLLGLIVLISIPFAVLEALTDRPLILEILDKVPVFRTQPNSPNAPRMGLERAQFVFAHPIHYGLWCGLAFGTVLIGLRGAVSVVRRILWASAIGLGTFLSLSSGPFLALMVQLGLIAYGFGMRRVTRHAWRIFGIGAVIFYVLVEVFSDRPAYLAIISRLVMSPYTAYLRATLLDYGLAQIGRTPVLGIGFYRDWGLPIWMSGSIDNHWLFTALTYGVPAFAFMFGAFLAALIGAGRRPFAVDSRLWNLRFGWMVVCIGLMLTIATVAIWAELQTICFFVLGSGVWFAAVTADDDVPDPATAADIRRLHYSRFGTSMPSESRLGISIAREATSYARPLAGETVGRPHHRGSRP